MNTYVPTGLKSLTTIVVTNLTTLAGAYLIFAGTQVQVEPEYVRVLQAENTELRAEFVEAQRENTRLQARIITLGFRVEELERTVIGGTADIEISAVKSVFYNVDRAGWCKKVEWRDGAPPDYLRGKTVFFQERWPEFVMEVNNPQYEVMYDISVPAYVGKTDFQVHSLEVALSYYRHDLETLLAKDHREFTEPHPANDGRQGHFAKWWVGLPLSDIELVCGLEIGSLANTRP